MNTFEEKFFMKEERWCQIYGPSLHPWNSEKFAKIGNALVRVVAIDPATLVITQLDAAQVKD